jgi:hypothetical protein
MVLRPDQRIADKLGVNQRWVNEVRDSLAKDGEFTGTSNSPTSHKSDMARNLITSIKPVFIGPINGSPISWELASSG